MAAGPDRFDVHFHPNHVGVEVSEWSSKDEILPSRVEPYYLKANTGPRWLLGSVLSRPFCTTKQSAGKFAISSIESSSVYLANVFARKLRFPEVHHMFVVFEGVLEVEVDGCEPAQIHQGETVFITKNVGFSLGFKSKFVRLWSFSTGDGIEALIQAAGSPHEGFVIPDEEAPFDEARMKAACEAFNVKLS